MPRYFIMNVDLNIIIAILILIFLVAVVIDSAQHECFKSVQIRVPVYQQEIDDMNNR